MAGTAPPGTGTPDDASDDGGDGFTVMGPEDALAPAEPQAGEDDAASGA